MHTHATFLEEDCISNFKPKSQIILEQLALAQEQTKSPVFWPIIPFIPMHVQKGKNVHECEQVQEKPEEQKEPVEQGIHNHEQNTEQDFPVEA